MREYNSVHGAVVGIELKNNEGYRREKQIWETFTRLTFNIVSCQIAFFFNS